MAASIKPSFARGEIAPGLHGRVDTAAYQIALALARNMIVHKSGGISNRGGLHFLGPVKDHTKIVRLIPFQFKSTDTYMLEFGNLYMRVIRNKTHVTETAQAITGITQANPAVVSIAAHGYSNGDEVLIDGVVGMTQVNGRRFKVAGVTGGTFQLTDQVTGANINSTAYTAYSSGGTGARIFTLVTPYVEADLRKLGYTQSADVVTLTHPSYFPKELKRTGHAAWTLTDMPVDPQQTYPTGLTLTVNGAAGTTTYRYRVTAENNLTAEESLPALNTTTRTITGATQANPVVVTSVAHGFANGDEVHISGVVGMTELNGRRFVIANVAANTFELANEDGTAYTAYSSGGSANRVFAVTATGNATLTSANSITVSWTAAAGAGVYSIYREKNGIFGFIGESATVSFTDEGAVAPDVTVTPPQPKYPFRGVSDRPGATGYYEQRRVFGGSNNKPDTSEYSRTGDQSNFTVSSPLQADDAITATLTSQRVNQIRHFVAGKDLSIFTSGEEWRVTAGENAAFSADTMRQKPQSAWGAGYQRPIVIGSTILYVQDNNSVIRSFGYSLEIDGYTGSDLTVFADHLFHDYEIVDWCYTSFPWSIIPVVRADGKAGVLTFEQQMEVLGWTRWDTPAGFFESCAAIRNSVDDADETPYFVVRRVVNGSTVRYIEYLDSRRFASVEDCFFVDSGLTYDQPKTITGVSLTNPVVVTCPSHGFSNGNQVDLDSIQWDPVFDDLDNEDQPEQLNEDRVTIANVTANTFEVSGVSGIGWNSYVQGGVARKVVTTLTGLHHLEGKTVVGLIDGNVVKNLVVSGGGLTPPAAFSRAHIGLRYISDLELLNLEVQRAPATTQHLLKHLTKVTVRLERSRGLWVGPNSDSLVEMKQREFEEYGEPTELLTGDKEIAIMPEWNTNGRLFFRQRDPLPLTFLSVVPHFELES